MYKFAWYLGRFPKWLIHKSIAEFSITWKIILELYILAFINNNIRQYVDYILKTYDRLLGLNDKFYSLLYYRYNIRTCIIRLCLILNVSEAIWLYVLDGFVWLVNVSRQYLVILWFTNGFIWLYDLGVFVGNDRFEFIQMSESKLILVFETQIWIVWTKVKSDLNQPIYNSVGFVNKILLVNVFYLN